MTREHCLILAVPSDMRTGAKRIRQLIWEPMRWRQNARSDLTNRLQSLQYMELTSLYWKCLKVLRKNITSSKLTRKYLQNLLKLATHHNTTLLWTSRNRALTGNKRAHLIKKEADQFLLRRSQHCLCSRD